MVIAFLQWLVMLISPLPPFFLGIYNWITSLWLCIAWYCCNIFRVFLSIISNSVMVQLSTGNAHNSAGMAYELIASKVCLQESSLFKIIFNRLKYSFLSADLVVLSMVKLSPNPKYLYCWFNSSDFSSSSLSSWMFPYEQFFLIEWWTFYICQCRSSFQYHHWIYWRFLSLMQTDCRLQQKV